MPETKNPALEAVVETSSAEEFVLSSVVNLEGAEYTLTTRTAHNSLRKPQNYFSGWAVLVHRGRGLIASTCFGFESENLAGVYEKFEDKHYGYLRELKKSLEETQGRIPNDFFRNLPQERMGIQGNLWKIY